MAASEARILANRENAKLSTGPRTEAGKLQARRNALRHGLASTGVVLLPEDEARLAERRRAWGEVPRPADEVEVFLVERAVEHSVKLERASAVESASAVALVERADDAYEADVLRRLEAAEAEVRAWERIGAELAGRGTILRDGIDAMVRLLGLEADDGGRRVDFVELSLAASPTGGRDEATRMAAREAMGDLIGARLEERRRAVARIFEEIDGPEGRNLARAQTALDTGPAGALARRYEEADERGLMRMLDSLDRRRKAAAKSHQPPDIAPADRHSHESGNLGKLPNEPNGHPTIQDQNGSGNLGKLPNVPNGHPTIEDQNGSGNLGKLPNEPNGVEAGEHPDCSGALGKLPNEPNGEGSAQKPGGPGDLGKLPNEPNDLGAAERPSDLGDLGKLPNEPNGRGAGVVSIPIGAIGGNGAGFERIPAARSGVDS